ncbi:class I SAM-dependent methyltransferase [Streptomyces sp. NPDC087659]|uniref:class I SAM-dependent methyltransferase n=1 Tax=Streptomyces sp. NPDC087659 TaxID=3365801 RepID=UPI003816A383
MNHGTRRKDLERSRQTVRTGRGTREFYERVFGAEILRGDGPILDLGAGDSPFGRERLGVVRVDPSYADDPPSGRGAVAALGQALPFADRTFTVVLASFVAQHVRDVEELVSELLRVVRPGGVLALHPVWRPVRARHLPALCPNIHLFDADGTAPPAHGPAGAAPRRSWKRPTLMVHRPRDMTTGQAGRISGAIAESRALVPPVAVAVPARWGMRAFVRVRGTARLTLLGNLRSRF